jgi:hypothetical protein
MLGNKLVQWLQYDAPLTACQWLRTTFGRKAVLRIMQLSAEGKRGGSDDTFKLVEGGRAGRLPVCGSSGLQEG